MPNSITGEGSKNYKSETTDYRNPGVMRELRTLTPGVSIASYLNRS